MDKIAEEVSKKVMTYLQQFKQEEIGNRLSNFAFASLESVIKTELDKLQKEIQNEETIVKDISNTPNTV